jgi:hypothetical protein
VVISYNTREQPQTITATVVGLAQIKALVANTLNVPATAATLDGVLAAGGYRTDFSAPAAGKLSLSWTAVSGGHRVRVATATNVAGHIGLRALPIKLTAAGQRLLYRAAHPPAPKPKRLRFKVKVKGKGKSKSNGKPKYAYKYKLVPQPPPPPRPVQITATVTFTRSGQAVIRRNRKLTLRAE